MNKFFNYTDVKELIPKKPLTANKYDFGNILLIGGEPGFEGAIMLSAESALKSGAGIINIFSLSGNVQNILEKRPEYMVLSKVDDLKKFLEKKITILLPNGKKEIVFLKNLNFDGSLLIEKEDKEENIFSARIIDDFN